MHSITPQSCQDVIRTSHFSFLIIFTRLTHKQILAGSHKHTFSAS
uniref:Uncharacterized protein n=1 Tax=Anguilla anguilla TaxID=7936 RepID=A0A0E9X9T0_ANGAN